MLNLHSYLFLHIPYILLVNKSILIVWLFKADLKITHQSRDFQKVFFFQSVRLQINENFYSFGFCRLFDMILFQPR